MRVRSVVLPAVFAVAAAVLTPTSAQAAPVQCGLLMPTKVVVNAPVVATPVTLTSGCLANGATHAYWDAVRGGAVVGQLDFESFELSQGVFDIEWEDTFPMGRWTLLPAGTNPEGEPQLTQNAPVVALKYGSKLTTSVTRSGSKLGWAVTATQWSGRAHAFVARPRASVGLFHQAPGSTTWTFVKAVTTSSTGKATVALAAPKAGTYRLKVAETPTVWAAYSRPVQGRR